uniref:Molybdopterin molybdenumtransferase n=1 Tax=Candidatus Kentrum sp. DK TaxID=2126562 RepID=A0A450SRJ2_9GAMM|nr:MAG: MoeA N-terminal region (domain I and II) [Candidatus Kentron sp. DK]
MKATHHAGGKGTLSVEQARARIAGEIDSVREWESVPLRDALGRVLARDILAPFPVPPYTNSAMDGYAIIGADLLLSKPASEFRVIGTAWAGRPGNDAIQTGQAIRIMTGAVLPAGADAVLMQEIEIGPPFYLSQGVKDVVVFDPSTLLVLHSQQVGAERHHSPLDIRLQCGCRVRL